MAKILNEQKSTGGNPYAYYTINVTSSNRTTHGVTISGSIKSHLQYDSSKLGTGDNFGLKAYITLNGVKKGPITLKATDVTWSGTSVKTKNFSFTIDGLTPSQISIPVKFRVSRTGTAENDYTQAAALKLTNCSALTIERGNSIVKIKNNNEFKDGIPYIKINGEWKIADEIYVKVNGEWKRCSR